MDSLSSQSGYVSTGAVFLDSYLQGGYEKGIITTLFGPSGSGKTNLCLLAACRVAESGKKVVLIDTEGGIAVERIKQLSSNWHDVLSRILFLQPLSFAKQHEILSVLSSQLDDTVGLIVIDSISMLYRLELGKSETVFETNSSLGRQIANLVEIARSRRIPVLITNQVYADFNRKDRVKMVGGDLLKYGSKCLLELQRDPEGQRSIILRKHRFLPEGDALKFSISSSGLEAVGSELGQGESAAESLGVGFSKPLQYSSEHSDSTFIKRS